MFVKGNYEEEIVIECDIYEDREICVKIKFNKIGNLGLGEDFYFINNLCILFYLY